MFAVGFEPVIPAEASSQSTNVDNFASLIHVSTLYDGHWSVCFYVRKQLLL